MNSTLAGMELTEITDLPPALSAKINTLLERKSTTAKPPILRPCTRHQNLSQTPFGSTQQ